MDREYVARQLNGPIIKGFIKCVYDFLHRTVESNRDYFGGLSIDTAEAYQLQVIGQLMGLQRFKLTSTQADMDSLTFTSGYGQQVGNTGFAIEYVNKSVTPDYPAGKFTETEYSSVSKQVIDYETYRNLLKLLAKYKQITNINVIIELIHIALDSYNFELVQDTAYLDYYDVIVKDTSPESELTDLANLLNSMYKNYIQFNITTEV